MRDLGLGGACVLVSEPLGVGDKITVSFVAPTLWDPLRLDAKVAWIGPPTHLEPGRAGVAFAPKDGAPLLALFELMGTLAYDE